MDYLSEYDLDEQISKLRAKVDACDAIAEKKPSGCLTAFGWVVFAAGIILTIIGVNTGFGGRGGGPAMIVLIVVGLVGLFCGIAGSISNTRHNNAVINRDVLYSKLRALEKEKQELLEKKEADKLQRELLSKQAAEAQKTESTDGENLAKYKSWLDQGLITREDYDQKKKQLLRL